MQQARMALVAALAIGLIASSPGMAAGGAKGRGPQSGAQGSTGQNQGGQGGGGHYPGGDSTTPTPEHWQNLAANVGMLQARLQRDMLGTAEGGVTAQKQARWFRPPLVSGDAQALTQGFSQLASDVQARKPNQFANDQDRFNKLQAQLVQRESTWSPELIGFCETLIAAWVANTEKVSDGPRETARGQAASFAALAQGVQASEQQMRSARPARGVARSKDGLTQAEAESLGKQINRINAELREAQPHLQPPPIDPLQLMRAPSSTTPTDA